MKTVYLGHFLSFNLPQKSVHSSHCVDTLLFMDTFDYFQLTHRHPVEV